MITHPIGASTITRKRQFRSATLVASCIFLAICWSHTVQGQILQPVKWQYAFKKVNDNEGVVMVRALIDEGWHIYGLNVPEGGPEKTVIRLHPSQTYTTVGKVLEPEPKKKHEEVFDMDVPYFDGAVVFQQKIRLKVPQTTVQGTIRFMVCDEDRCLPAEDIEFAIKIQ